MYFIPEYVQKVIDTLCGAGYEAYIVGGPVRDILIGNLPDDYDIATSCPPDKTMELFPKTIATGIKHGTVTVVVQEKNIEVTTYRTDGKYINHRSPEKVNFVSSINEDLSRRDFTINAMAYNKTTGIIDLFGGRDDLRQGIIRCVGKPENRFNEDALRILRAFRFAAKLGFDIEEKTLQAIKTTLHLLPGISRERIFSELSKILISQNPQVIETLINLGGLRFLGIEQASSITQLSVLPVSLPLRFYAFCKICRINAYRLCQELKTDNKLKEYCINMERLFDNGADISKVGLKHMLNMANVATVHDYLLLLEVLNGAKIRFAKTILDEIIMNREPYLTRHLALNGNDIISKGFNNEQVGIILKQLLEIVIENPKLNNKTDLTEILNNIQ